MVFGFGLGGAMRQRVWVRAHWAERGWATACSVQSSSFPFFLTKASIGTVGHKGADGVKPGRKEDMISEISAGNASIGYVGGLAS
jgi:hypothetical protein